MVSAVVHGNELCRAIVLDWLPRLCVRPLAGRLTPAFVDVVGRRLRACAPFVAPESARQCADGGMCSALGEGEPVGFDVDRAVTTPHDDCMLIMPLLSRLRGESAVRLRRYAQ